MSGLRLTFWGAAGQVTGSMHLLEAAGARILLDGGLFQGHRSESHRLNVQLPFDARRVDAVVLSHSHIDHSGRLPLLVKEGFHGPIYATPASRDLSAVMLADAAHIQEKDHEAQTASLSTRSAMPSPCRISWSAFPTGGCFMCASTWHSTFSMPATSSGLPQWTCG
jgi:metallo-beta-lactamase family protein